MLLCQGSRDVVSFRRNAFDLAVRNHAKYTDLNQAFKYSAKNLIVTLFFNSNDSLDSFLTQLDINVADLFTTVRLQVLSCEDRAPCQSDLPLRATLWSSLLSYDATDHDAQSPTTDISLTASVSDLKEQSICADATYIKLVKCHLIDKCLLKTDQPRPKRIKTGTALESDPANYILATNEIHGYIDGDNASGVLIAVLKPEVREEYPSDGKGLHSVKVELRFHRGQISNKEAILSSAALKMKPGATRIEEPTGEFPFGFAVEVKTPNPKRFVYCMAFKHNDGVLKILSEPREECPLIHCDPKEAEDFREALLEQIDPMDPYFEVIP